ncbi:MAG: hypothetical protein K9I85_10610, partial [Saprospiraceae bacterium]|nr:hypothetical protein [Saprospiraceae bacterium]
EPGRSYLNLYIGIFTVFRSRMCLPARLRFILIKMNQILYFYKHMRSEGVEEKSVVAQIRL